MVVVTKHVFALSLLQLALLAQVALSAPASGNGPPSLLARGLEGLTPAVPMLRRTIFRRGAKEPKKGKEDEEEGEKEEDSNVEEENEEPKEKKGNSSSSKDEESGESSEPATMSSKGGESKGSSGGGGSGEGGMKTVKFTYYWDKNASEENGASGSVPLKDCNGKTLGTASKKFAEEVRMEGYGELADGAKVGLGGCDCNGGFSCFQKTDGPLGSDSNPLVEFVSIAANDIKKGTSVYVKELDGVTLPNGQVSDGCTRVDDESWSFDGGHIDFYVKDEKNYEELSQKVDGNVSIKINGCTAKGGSGGSSKSRSRSSSAGTDETDSESSESAESSKADKTSQSGTKDGKKASGKSGKSSESEESQENEAEVEEE
ncbi:hypothetical protein H4R34_004758 [Dimargaris verticillata]|uniref:Uncharacterized protein n=1 Tax=Dimargaris verticillata TaxID=2761393 RepID=A0A9W8B4Y0_9FUNG|nr:hypothetical protein H4R34_004758 [Dimargaris verticillata]